jgi:hypothetical protein
MTRLELVNILRKEYNIDLPISRLPLKVTWKNNEVIEYINEQGHPCSLCLKTKTIYNNGTKKNVRLYKKV